MRDKYDVAIYGLWYGNNYGSIITYYALSKVMEKMGLSYAMIRNPLGREINIDALERSHPLKFAKGRYDITPLLSLKDLKKLNSSFSAFLLGSDQMWNYNLSRPYQQSYFFDFVDDDKIKIAYATSFGKDKYIGPEEEKVRTYRNLHRFDGVSVRDDFSQRICKEDFDVDAELLMDPVFLCPVEKYEELIDETKGYKKNVYIFAYILDPNPEIGKSLEKISAETNKKIIVAFNQSGDKNSFIERLKIKSDLINFELDPTVNEWLSLYKYADYVLTDSFHGTCFSIIFHKKFIVLKNNGRGGARFPYLLGNLGLLNRMIEKPQEFFDKLPTLIEDINYDNVDEIISEQRIISYRWLEDKLENIKYDNKTIKKVIDEKKCTGCGACAYSCPKSAIELVNNKEGFINPVIDKSLCVKCGICLNKCIADNPKYKNNPEPNCYAMMASDEIRKKSSSGGMFTVAAEHILNNGGYVCGAAYRDDFSVEHILIDNINDLGKLRGSKYIQSNCSCVFPKVKQLLEEQKVVLFTGMPCQVAGLYSYLGKEYESLYTIDLLCHGITSYKVFEKYHNDVLNGKELSRLEFKEKEPWGWHAGINAYFTDGTKYQKPLQSDMYFIAYLKSIAKNTSCEKCVSNKLPRQGDLTIGDFWGIPKYDPEMNDGLGTSVVLVNNEKAERFFEQLKIQMKKVNQEPLGVAVRGNNVIKKPYKLHKNRDLFFEKFDELKFQDLTMGCYKNQLNKELQIELERKIPLELHEYYYLAKTVAKHSKGRKIVTWIKSAKFKKILHDFFNIDVAFSVAITPSLIDNKEIFPISAISRNASQYYIVVLDANNYKESYEILEGNGYKEIEDFICKVHRPIVINDWDFSKSNYYDEYGNTIEGISGKIGKIVLRGCNNHILVSEKNVGLERLKIDLTSNSYIEIGKENKFNSEFRIITKGFNGISKLCIRDRIRFTDVLCRVYNSKFESSILINEDCTFETNFELHANAGKKIIIGRDCMFSHDIDLWAGDGHSIFDVTTGKNINSDYENIPQYKNTLVIGEHVWISKGTFIMHGTNIGNGSIVGAKSVVKGFYPNNCTIGGNPAAIIKRNSAWSRDMETNDSDKCGKKEYYALTSDAKAPISGAKVLVIGGTRFMGVHLVKNLIALGNDVTIASRGHKKDGFGTDVKRKIIDVHDAESIKREFNGEYYDVIFDNLASCSATVDNIVKNIECKRYIQLSSIAVYRGRKMEMQEEMYDVMSLKPEIEDIPLNYSSKEYGKGKRLAEAYLYQCCKKSAVTVRIPYVSPTNRIFNYCDNIVKGIPFKVTDKSRIFTFVQAEEVGHFLPWIAAQDYEGPINFSSEGYVSIGELISYIEQKTGKSAIIDNSIEVNEIFREKSFSLSLDKVKSLGYSTTNIRDWFWRMVDEYIVHALK